MSYPSERRFHDVALSMKVFLDSLNELPAMEKRDIVILLKKKICLTCGSERKGTGSHCPICGEGLPS